MDILSVLTYAQLHPKKATFWREKWLSDNGRRSSDGETDYTIPSYIFWDGDEQQFVAVFSTGDWQLRYNGPTIEEDFMNGVIVSHWSTEDILATDWRLGDDRSIFKSKGRANKDTQS